MRKVIVFVFGIWALSFFLISCGGSDSLDVSDIEVPFEIERFERKLIAVKSKAELTELLKQNEPYVRSLYRAFPEDTAFVSHLYYLCTHPETRKLYDQTQAEFGDLEDFKKELEGAFKHIKYYYPAFKAPKIMTTFTGLENDIFVSDSLVIIALEAFVGPKALYRPDQPDFILNRYSKEYLVPTIIKFLSNSYVKTTGGDQTFLADMMFFGKALEFTKEMMPSTPDSLIMGYSEQVLQDTWNSQDLVWGHFIDKNLLYNQNPSIKEKYLGERPAVPEIGPKCPGRIGQWIGWRIVKRYRLEEKEISFQELMAQENPGEIFQKSKYKGQLED